MTKPTDAMEAARIIATDIYEDLGGYREVPAWVATIASTISAAVALEREACAEVAQRHIGAHDTGAILSGEPTFGERIAAAIRARGEG